MYDLEDIMELGSERQRAQVTAMYLSDIVKEKDEPLLTRFDYDDE